MGVLIEASNIKQGEFFRKERGTYVFLRISRNALLHIGAEYPDAIHGVSFNGNIARVAPNVRVYRCDLEEFAKNIWDNREWHMKIAGRRVR